MLILRHCALLVALPRLALAAYTFNPLEHLAGIAPYFRPQDPPLGPNPPQGCNVTRAAYLVRHAAIYVNDFDCEAYIEPLVTKLVNASVDWTRSHSLSFLSTWQNPIKQSDQEQLMQAGELEPQSLGIEISQRHPTFRPPKRIWASQSGRTAESAQSFIEGFVRHENEIGLVKVSEGRRQGANSPEPYKSCRAYSSSSGASQSKARLPHLQYAPNMKELITYRAKQVYQDLYTRPIIARFKAEVPNFSFTTHDVIGMQALCGYETAIRGSSPFCSPSVFGADEWLAFEYANDIRYHYNIGYGNDLSGVIGFPWANATAQLLLADGADEDMYVSFVHRRLPSAVAVAFGLFNNSAFSGADDVNATMPLNTINHRRAWRSSHIVPFLGNVAVERMACDSYGFQDDSTMGEYYRALVNQNPQPLPACTDGPGASCSRAGFVRFMEQRQEMFAGFSQRCGNDYLDSTDVLGIYQS